MTENNQIEKLVNLLSSKYSTTLSFNSKISDFQTRFPTPLILDKNYNYEIALTWFTTYNNIFNINNSNNIFKISYGNSTQILKITPGSYELETLFTEMRKLINEVNNKIYKVDLEKIKTDWKNFQREEKDDRKTTPIDFKINMTTSRSECFVYAGFSFYPDKLSNVLGFTQEKYSENSTSEKYINISNITSINLICDLIEGTYQDGKRNNCLYNFPYGTVPHGYKIIQIINTPIYLPINKKTIDSIRFKIVDQEDNLLDFNSENISFSLHLKQV